MTYIIVFEALKGWNGACERTASMVSLRMGGAMFGSKQKSGVLNKCMRARVLRSRLMYFYELTDVSPSRESVLFGGKCRES